jgi:hypothetical protein
VCNLIKIFGKLTDFDGKAIANGIVSIDDAQFNAVYTTNTDEYGNYSLEVEKGMYMAIVAVKDHGVNKLEYWGWNLSAFEDTEINARIDGLEIYAINAFMIQRSHPYNSMMIYFRPMSLKRVLKVKEKMDGNNEVIDISPNLNEDDIDVKLNGGLVSILGINRIIEKAVESHQKVIGYLIQVSIPENERKQEYINIHITLRDSETGEKGEGSLFWQKPKSFDVVSEK